MFKLAIYKNSLRYSYSQLTEVKPLLIGHVQESCVNNITRNAFIGLYLAILKPCGEDNQIKDSDNQL